MDVERAAVTVVAGVGAAISDGSQAVVKRVAASARSAGFLIAFSPRG
jgi:hypothetical protein